MMKSTTFMFFMVGIGELLTNLHHFLVKREHSSNCRNCHVTEESADHLLFECEMVEPFRHADRTSFADIQHFLTSPHTPVSQSRGMITHLGGHLTTHRHFKVANPFVPEEVSDLPEDAL